MSAPSNGDDVILVEQRGDGVVVLTLNRPQARNAVSFELWEALDDAIAGIERGDPPRAVVITGAGQFFCAGGDLKTPPARGVGAVAPAARLELGQRVIDRLRKLPVPVIAAVEGGAYGMGWSLALACDMVIASAEARFCAPFLSLGLIPDGGFVWFLRRQLGVYRAAEVIFSERLMPADEALALGLVSKTVAAGQTVTAALEFAAAMAKGNRHSVELTKRLLLTAESTDLAQHSALELALGVMCQTGDEVARVRAARK